MSEKMLAFESKITSGAAYAAVIGIVFGAVGGDVLQKAQPKSTMVIWSERSFGLNIEQGSTTYFGADGPLGSPEIVTRLS